MASRPAPVGTAFPSRQAPVQEGPTTAQIIATGHVGLSQPLAEGIDRLNLLDMFVDRDSPTDPFTHDEFDRPEISSSTIVKTDTGSITTISFDDGASLVINRVQTDTSTTTTSTRTEADGDVSVVTSSITKVDHDTTTAVVTSDTGTTTTTIDHDTGTLTVDTVSATGDHATFVQTNGSDGFTGQYSLVQADGDTGTLDYSLLDEGATKTLTVEGNTADGVVVDSTVVIDLDTRVVTVTDHQGDIATFSLKHFHAEVLDHGLIGVIADVDTGYFG